MAVQPHVMAMSPTPGMMMQGGYQVAPAVPMMGVHVMAHGSFAPMVAGTAPMALAPAAAPGSRWDIVGPGEELAAPAQASDAAAELARLIATGGQIGEEVDAVTGFTQKWGLNSTAVEWMYTLDPTVRSTVMTQFAPRCKAEDVQKMLYGFAKSIAARQGMTIARLAGPYGMPGSVLPPMEAGDGGVAASETVESYAQRMGLDVTVVDWLRSLDGAVQATIMTEFSPQQCPTQEDLVQKLFAFGRSVSQRHSSGGALPSELRGFVQRWGLDNEGLTWLLGLLPKVQGVVVREFAPHETPVDVISKLRAFAGSVERKVGMQLAGIAPGGVLQVQGGQSNFEANSQNQRLREFAGYWQLDEAAQSTLFSLAPNMAHKIVDDFDPRGDTTNLNRKFMAFVRTLTRGIAGGVGPPSSPGAPLAQQAMPMGQPMAMGHAMAMVNAAPMGHGMPMRQAPLASFPLLDSFSAHWNLAPDVKEYLMSLHMDVCTEIINRFDPPVDATRDVNRKLMGFAKSVAAAPRISQPVAMASGFGGQPMPARPSGGHMAPNVAASALPVTLSADEHAFLARWGLGGAGGGGEYFARVPAEVRARVVADFAPRAGTRDLLRLFVGFVTAVSRKMQTGEVYGQSPASFQSMAPSAPSLHHRAPVGPAGGGVNPNDTEGFADRWGLDAGSRALLRGLPDEARWRCILEFNPRGVCNDIGGKFCAFARSIAAAVAAEDGSHRGVKRPADAMAGLSMMP